MNRTVRTTLSITLPLVLLLSGCGNGEPEPMASPQAQESEAAPMRGTDAGSGDAADSTNSTELARDNAAFLERLGLIRGHLHAGHALYVDGKPDMARTHMKHPRDELYADLVPAIEARALSPFDAELNSLKNAVDSGAPGDDVTAAWREVDGAIERIERATGATPQEELLAIAAMLDMAAEEYAIGVVDGVVDNVHEYQDAWGFTRVALERVGQIASTTDVEREATAEAGVAISSLEDLWPNLDPKVRLEVRSERITGAADRIRALAEGIAAAPG